MSLAAGAALLLLAMPAGAPAAERQTVTAKGTTKTPGAPLGVTVHAVYAAADGDAHPHALRHVSDDLPPGTTIRAQDIPKCTASELELTVRGAAACPQGSIVGRGEVHTNLGLGGFGRLVTDVTLINAGTEILFLGSEPRTQVKLVQHGILRGRNIDVDILKIPSTSSEGAWLEEETFSLEGRSGLLRAPTTCPTGTWTFTRVHTYGDGVIQTTRAPMPCTKPAKKHRKKKRKHG